MNRKEVRPYFQRGTQSCGPSCVLMILDYYKLITNSRGDPTKPTPRMETALYNDCRSQVRWNGEQFQGVQGASMAHCLARRYNMDVRLIHSCENGMENRKGFYPDELFAMLLEEYRDMVEKLGDQITPIRGRAISPLTLRQELAAGRQIIVQAITGRTLHWILVCCYENGEFLVCDPRNPAGDNRKLRLTEEAMENRMDAPIGKILVSVKEREDD